MEEVTDIPRKQSHIDLANTCQTSGGGDPRFDYEPLLSGHPTKDYSLECTFLNKKLKAPLWISSITGGTKSALTINRRLATAAKEFGIGMGVGSCRPLLESEEKFRKDFDLREFIGEDLPLYGNLGVAQVEKLLAESKIDKISKMIEKYKYDGLIIHVNPIQEWLQPEGDRFINPPIETITRVIKEIPFPIIVKEVGQGMGPKSLRSLMKLPLAAIEFGARGGTNFSLIEEKRETGKASSPLTTVGHSADEMVDIVATLIEELGDRALCQEFIISGGMKSSLDGFAHMKSLNNRAVIGFAYKLVSAANSSYEQLTEFLRGEIELLKMANCYLTKR